MGIDTELTISVVAALLVLPGLVTWVCMKIAASVWFRAKLRFVESLRPTPETEKD